MKIFIDYPDGGKKRYNVLPTISLDELKDLASGEMETDASSVSLELLDPASGEWKQTGDQLTLKKLDTLRAQMVTKVRLSHKYYAIART